jgi:predicted HD phosphohydrolase
MTDEIATTSPTPGTERRSPLLHDRWQYVATPVTQELTGGDWDILDSQRDPFYREVQAEAVLRMLRAGKDEPTFGYQVNHYVHGLQTATMLMRDGRDDEDVVVALLHDIGFVTCPERHGAFAAELLGAYISERNDWMLRHHQAVGDVICSHGAGASIGDADWARWRGSRHFEWTYEFVERYDLNAMDPSYENAPLEVFEPMVRRIFTRERSLPDRPLVVD